MVKTIPISRDTVNKDMGKITEIGPLIHQKVFKREIKAKDQKKEVAKEARAKAKARDHVGHAGTQTISREIAPNSNLSGMTGNESTR